MVWCASATAVRSENATAREGRAGTLLHSAKTVTMRAAMWEPILLRSAAYSGSVVAAARNARTSSRLPRTTSKIDRTSTSTTSRAAAPCQMPERVD